MTEEQGSNETFSEPSSNDVLFGKGHVSQTHPGNRHYRNIIVSKKRLYVRTKKHREKDAIARQVLREIQMLDPPGRFMARNKDGMWSIQSEAMAISKIKQALRENNSRKNFNPSVWCQDDSNPQVLQKHSNLTNAINRTGRPISMPFPIASRRPWPSSAGQMRNSEHGMQANKLGIKDGINSSSFNQVKSGMSYVSDEQVLSGGSLTQFPGKAAGNDSRRHEQKQWPAPSVSAQTNEKSSQNDGLLLLSHVALLSHPKN